MDSVAHASENVISLSTVTLKQNLPGLLSVSINNKESKQIVPDYTATPGPEVIKLFSCST